MVGCSKKRKADCLPPNCSWVPNRGCRLPKYSPAAPLGGCSKKKKAECQASPNCKWVTGKGCRVKSSKKSRSLKRKSASPKRRSPKRKSAKAKRLSRRSSPMAMMSNPMYKKPSSKRSSYGM